MTDQTPQDSGQAARVDLPWYSRLSIPPLTAIATPQETVLRLPRGETEFLWIEMPSGCAGLVGLQVWRLTWQIFPRPEGQWYVSNGTTVKLRFREVIADDPLNVTIKAYNLDAIENHHPWLAFEMVAQKTPLSQKLLAFIDFLGGS